MINLYVPSKNRVDNSSLLSFADKTNFKLKLVVEPQEYNSYKSKFKNFEIIILPENNKGISYVRNFIKNYSLNNLEDNYWQLDDDITGLFIREKTKLIRTDLNILLLIQEIFLKNNIAIGSLEYRQFAWSATKDFIINSFCDSCVFIDNIKTKDIFYNNYLEGKEDRDFAMQVIKNGNLTSRITKFAFSSPPNGSNKGGLKEIFYDIGKEEICANRMVEVWGENICNKIIKKDGRIDVKIKWENINSKQKTLF